MKFKSFLSELSMRVGSYESLKSYLPSFEHLLKDGEHCGDIEQFSVYKQQRGAYTDYAVGYQGIIVAFFVVLSNELMNAYVVEVHRKQGLFSAFLFFLKRNEGLSKIVIGELQSEDTIEAIRRIHKRFKTSWEKDGIKEPYDPNSLEQYYSYIAPTGWKIVLENHGDFSSWPKFFDLNEAMANGKLAEAFYFEPFVEQ